jgi:ABC-type sugar transport system substrate-binding protein
MKKVFSIILSLVLMVSMFTGFSSASSKVTYPAAAKLPRYKMGVLLWGYTDVLGASVKKNLQYIGKQFNVEMVFAEGGMNNEAYITATENLIQSGCKGIISLTAFAGQIAACEKAHVYFGVMLNEIADDKTRKQAAASKYFVGMVTENDEQCGEAMVNSLYAKGSRNIVYLAPPPGNANHDNRVRGIETAIKKHSDLKLLTDYRGIDQAEALQGFAATYPEMDGVIVTGGSNGGIETIYQTMQAEGLTARGVKLATIDIGVGTDKRLAAGDLSWIAGGQFPTTGIAFTLVYNALNGNNILADKTKTLYRNFMVLQNKADYDKYEKYVEGAIPPYSGDDLKALIVKFNPKANEALYKEYSKNYTIDNLVARHKGLVK